MLTNGTSTSAPTEQLILDHLPLVQHVVAGTVARVPRHVQRDELISAALLALVQAAHGFDAERGVPFERFAQVRMRGAVVDVLRGHDWASRPTRAAGKRMSELEGALASKLGRRPTPEELGAELGISADAVARLRADIDRATVVSYTVLAEHGNVEQVLPALGRNPEDEILDRERRAYLVDAVATLPDRLRAVVVGYFFDERPMAELADELGVTRSRISQMRAEALLLLRDAMCANLETARPRESASGEMADGVAARRRAAYCAEVASRSDYRTRLDARPVIVPRAG